MSISMSVRRWCLGLAIAGLASSATGLSLASHDPGGASQVVRKWPPPDFTASEPELLRLRDRLRDIVQRRDVEQLVTLMAPAIRFDFEDYTPEKFIAMVRGWSREPAEDFWYGIRDALELPMAFDRPYAVAPYVAVTNEALVVVANRVALRAEPAPDSKVVAWLTYGPIDEAGDPIWDERRPATIDGYDYGWHRARTRSGAVGWASSKFVRSPMDTRLLFERVDGGWRIWGIATGD